MNRFNALLNSHFKGCECLAVVWDDCRNRRVRYFDIGEAGRQEDGTLLVGYCDYEPTTDTPMISFVVPAINPHRGLDLVFLLKHKEVRTRGTNQTPARPSRVRVSA